MSKSKKIKYLLDCKNIRSKDYAKELGLSTPQALNNKYIRESFSSDDLIKLANITHTKLMFYDYLNDKVLIELDIDDLSD